MKFICFFGFLLVSFICHAQPSATETKKYIQALDRGANEKEVLNNTAKPARKEFDEERTIYAWCTHGNNQWAAWLTFKEGKLVSLKQRTKEFTGGACQGNLESGFLTK